MELGLSNRIALVCGASRGFGLAIATSLAREGAKLVICARNEGPLHEAAAQLRRLGTEVVALPCDVTCADDLQRLVEAARTTYGRIDILVLNTAHPKMGSFSRLDETDWRDGFEDIFVPVLRLLGLVVPIMREQGWGRIVNISTSAVRVPSSTYLLSGVYRTALASLCKSLANEYGRDGIVINSVCPGLFRTPLGQSLLDEGAKRRQISPEQAEADYAADTAVGRIGDPAQLGDFVAMLCGTASAHVTGQLLTIDGGKTPSLF